jgi:hypothetical protein
MCSHVLDSFWQIFTPKTIEENASEEQTDVVTFSQGSFHIKEETEDRGHTQSSSLAMTGRMTSNSTETSESPAAAEAIQTETE